MSYNPNNPNGAATGANSAPVVSATDDANLKGFAASGAGGYVRQDSNATIAKESGGNLAAIKTDTDKIPSQGQALAAASMPVVLTAAQVTTLTPPSAITDYALETGGNLSTIATITANSATSANQTNGNQQTKLTDGTNTANVVAGDSGFNGVATAGGSIQHAFTTSTTGVQTIGPYNAEGYTWVEVNYTSVGTGLALTGMFAPSSGGVYFNTGSVWANGPTGALSGALGTVVNNTYYTRVFGNSFQLAVSALTSGTFSGTITFRAMPPPWVNIQANQNGTWTVTGTNSNSTGTITTSSSSITMGSTSGQSGYASVTINGTYSGVSFGITQSDNSSTGPYYNTSVYDVNAEEWLVPGATITPGTNASKQYLVPINSNAAEIKVLASAYSSGTANIRITYGVGNVAPSTMSQIMDAAGNARGANVDANGNLQSAATDYPTAISANAIPITASSGNVANASAVATLAAVSGKTTYITGFEITSSGATTGLVVNATVTGTITGSLTYNYAAPAGALVMGTPLFVSFEKPIPASASNTPIVVTLPALGVGNTNAAVNAHGYQL